MSTRPLALVIDDYDNTREMYAEVLRLEGFTGEGASDGQVALQKAMELLHDIIITDRLPPFALAAAFAAAYFEPSAAIRHLDKNGPPRCSASPGSGGGWPRCCRRRPTHGACAPERQARSLFEASSAATL